MVQTKFSSTGDTNLNLFSKIVSLLLGLSVRYLYTFDYYLSVMGYYS